VYVPVEVGYGLVVWANAELSVFEREFTLIQTEQIKTAKIITVLISKVFIDIPHLAPFLVACLLS
jgi:hypothetical protein